MLHQFSLYIKSPKTGAFCYDGDMKLYVARHGRSNYNDLRLFNSDPTVDVHLTDVGIQQAEDLAKELKDIQFNQIFVSELRRTQQTAEVVNKTHNAPIVIEPRLNDHTSGLEGLPYEAYDEYIEKASDRWSLRIKDGESIIDVKTRMQNFLDDLKTKDYDNVLLVTSMYNIRTVYLILKNISYDDAWKMEVLPATFAVFDI